MLKNNQPPAPQQERESERHSPLGDRDFCRAPAMVTLRKHSSHGHAHAVARVVLGTALWLFGALCEPRRAPAQAQLSLCSPSHHSLIHGPPPVGNWESRSCQEKAQLCPPHPALESGAVLAWQHEGGWAPVGAGCWDPAGPAGHSLPWLLEEPASIFLHW